MIRLLARTSTLMLTFAIAILLARLVGSAAPETCTVLDAIHQPRRLPVREAMHVWRPA